MPRLLRIEHEDGFDLVDAPAEGEESLGERRVINRDGVEELRHKVRRPSITYTDCELPPDYEGSPQELVHLMQTWNDRHFEKATSVSGDEEVGPKIAALLGCPYTGPELAAVEEPAPAQVQTPVQPTAIEVNQ